MRAENQAALAGWLLALADDELVLGHRDSEWCGHAPILEEDIAFANIALDEIGHAMIWYGLLAGLIGEDQESFPDRQVYYRDAGAFRSVQMVAMPKGDWAFTMVRQYLFDVAESIRLAHLTSSRYQPIREAAAKIQKEELYHLRHTQAWIRRLGLGTDESLRRTQAALDHLWGYALQLFVPLPGEADLAAEGLVPASEKMRETWVQQTSAHLQASGLQTPETSDPPAASRDQQDTHLEELLAELQSVARADPGAIW